MRGGGRATPSLAGLTIAADPAAWTAAGFAVRGAECQIGTAKLRLAGADAGDGILGWSFRGLRADDLGGPASAIVDGDAPPPAPPHPNSATVLDHVVVTAPDLAATLAAFERAGFELRRVREAGGDPPMHQGFYLAGDCVLEVAGPAAAAPPDAGAAASLWGLVVVVTDLDAVAGHIRGDSLSPVRDAVQPGRRIATVRASAGLGTEVAVMTPRPARD